MKSYRGTIFVPPAFLAHLFPQPGDDVAAHRFKVKLYLMGRRQRFIQEDPPDDDRHMHEGMVSRAEAMGWDEALRVLIHTPYNCILITRDQNLGLSGQHPPGRLEVYEEKCLIYGRDQVDSWLLSLPFKVPPKWFPRR